MQLEESAPQISEILGEARVTLLQLKAASRSAHGTASLLALAVAACLSIAAGLVLLVASNRALEVLGSSVAFLPAACLVIFFCCYRLFLAWMELRAVVNGVDDLAQIQQHAIYEAEKWIRLDEGAP